MAITIKNIPVLEGVTAEDFVRSGADRKGKVTRLSVSKETAM